MAVRKHLSKSFFELAPVPANARIFQSSFLRLEAQKDKDLSRKTEGPALRKQLMQLIEEARRPPSRSPK